MHDVHCGSSDGLIVDAMECCGAAEALMTRKSAAKHGIRDASRAEHGVMHPSTCLAGVGLVDRLHETNGKGYDGLQRSTAKENL